MATDFQSIVDNTFTSTELKLLGHSDRKIRTIVAERGLVKLRRGVFLRYQVWNQLQPWEIPLAHIAAYLRTTPHTVFSHTSAALLHGFAVPLNQEVHILGVPTARGKVHGVVKHFPKNLPETMKLSSGVTVTSPLQTIVDSAKILEPAQGLALADSALRVGSVVERELRDALKTASGKGASACHFLAKHFSVMSESPAESYTRFLLIYMGLEFSEQEEIWVEGRMFRVDFRLTGTNILVEFDGRLKLTDYGASDQVLEKERYREKTLQNQGFAVFRVGWADVTGNFHQTVSRLRRFIQATGTRRYCWLLDPPPS